MYDIPNKYRNYSPGFLQVPTPGFVQAPTSRFE